MIFNLLLYEVLDEMEATATDKKDKPTTDIKLISAHLFVDSISDTREELINLEKEKKKAAKEAEKSKVNGSGDYFKSQSSFLSTIAFALKS